MTKKKDTVTVYDNKESMEFERMKARIKELKGELLILNFAIILLGIVMVAIPKQFNDFIGQILGCVLCVWGVLRCITFFRLKKDEVFGNYSLVQGAAMLGFGIFFLTQPDRFSSLLNTALTLFVMITAVLKLQNAINYLKLGIKKWWLHLIAALILLVFGIIAIIRPGFVDNKDVLLNIMTVLTGVSFIVSGLWDLISTMVLSKAVNTAVDTMQKEGVTPSSVKKAVKHSRSDAKAAKTASAETVHFADHDVEEIDMMDYGDGFDEADNTSKKGK